MQRKILLGRGNVPAKKPKKGVNAMVNQLGWLGGGGGRTIAKRKGTMGPEWKGKRPNQKDSGNTLDKKRVGKGRLNKKDSKGERWIVAIQKSTGRGPENPRIRNGRKNARRVFHEKKREGGGG